MGSLGRENFHTQPEKTENSKKEALDELDGLKDAKNKISEALKWLNRDFKQNTYRLLIEAQDALKDDEQSTEKFKTLKEAQDKVIKEFSESIEIQNLKNIDLTKFKHFNSYSTAREIADISHLDRYKTGQKVLLIGPYLEKLSTVQVALDNYINQTLFFLTAKQKNLNIPTQPDLIPLDEDEPKIINESGDKVNLE
jgi:hypothetical protein